MDKLGAMAAFVQVAKCGSFTKAGSELLLSPSAITKNILKLEKSLGVRLINRTTHNSSLTDEGELYLKTCIDVLETINLSEQTLARRHDYPQGSLRIAAPNATGRIFLTPTLPQFLKENPGIRLELMLSDQKVDLIEQGLDLAISVGLPRISHIISRKLADTNRVTLASPQYFEKHGYPTTIEDLNRHNCISLQFAGRRVPWRFKNNDADVHFEPSGNLVVNSGDELREATLAGIGIAQLNSFPVEPDLRLRRLIPILLDHVVPSDSIQVVYLQSRHKQPRIRAFLTFLDRVFRPYATPTDLKSLA